MTDARTLTATCRLQVNKDFTLAHVRDIVAYLHRLGVSHVYTSPVLGARPGSTHGYDVADPSRLNPELGTEDDRRALVDELHRHQMGWVLDIVPNHMGTGPANPYWEDVLTHGRASRYAHWFDIDWAPPDDRFQERVLLPVLGDRFDKVLARDEFSVVDAGGALRLKYFDNLFPVAPETAAEAAEFRARGELAAFGAGEEGRRRLRALLDAQHYALVFWRHAPEEINYRRFFDVNELVALRMEDPRVFEETHAVILDWVRRGDLDALRVDHIDGLLDPLGYLVRLKAEARAPIFVEKILSPGEHLRAEWPVQGTTGYEFLNDLEAVFVDPAGAAALEESYRQMLKLREGAPRFQEVALRGKAFVLHHAFVSDVRRLVRLLARIARATPAGAGLRREQLAAAVTELLVCLPVYRTYVDGRTPAPHPDDRAMLDRALARVRARNAAPPAARDFLAQLFLEPATLDDASPGAAARLRFVQRFQQTSGPATAKGVEDTAIYQYVPLASRNEVGGEPDRDLADAVGTLHRANAERAARWPQALVATNTHDTKRSADLRARLDVLSEIPDDWARLVARWRRLNRPLKVKVKGRLEPDANTEYLLYQSMVGIWPAAGLGVRPPALGGSSAGRDALAKPTEPGGPASPRAEAPAETVEQLRERLEAYLLKAAREAKMRTSWTDQNEAFEGAVKQFLGALLDRGRSAIFLAELDGLVARIARPGFWNALSRTLIHLTVPGTPDLYQGDELWGFSLVDPDNRRPVDFAERGKLLREIEARCADTGSADETYLRMLLDSVNDGRIKLYVIRQVLRARRARAALMREGSYIPLDVQGPAARQVLAFARRLGSEAMVTIAPRFSLTLTGGDAPACGTQCWSGTSIVLPEELGDVSWRDALTGSEVRASGENGRASIPVGDALGVLPVSLLVADS